jgi:hypothetical protein
MRGLAPPLPPAFSLLQSEFNDFLYAPIGEEGNDAPLTVLSALARLGIDPWQESARLARLSRDLATQSLTSMIAKLPDGRWAQSDAGAIAARLVALLPAKGASVSSPRCPASGQPLASSRTVMFLIAAALGAVMFFAVTNLMRPAAPSTTDNAPAAVKSDPGQ